MVNREIRSSGTTWTGMTLHTFLLLPAKRSKSICPSLPEAVNNVCKVMPVHVVPDGPISRFTLLKEPLSIELGPVA